MTVVMPHLVARELLRESRRRSHFVWRALFVIGLGVLITWQWRGIEDLFAGTKARAGDVAKAGLILFSWWAQAQFVAGILFATVRCGALAEERRIGSLELLRASLLGEKGIIAGLFTSAMGRTLFTMSLALPVLAAIRSFGGFTLEQVGLATLATAVAAAFACAVTLLVCSASDSAGGAIVVSLLLQGGAYAPALVASRFYAALPVYLSPVLFFREVVSGGSIEAKAIGIFLGVQAALILACAIAASGLLARGTVRSGRTVKAVLRKVDALFLKVAGSRLVLWTTGLGRCRGRGVFWRERAVSVIGRRDHLIRIFAWVTFGLLLVAGVGALVRNDFYFMYETAEIGVVLAPLALIGAILVVGPSTAFVRERRKGSLEALAVTPIPSHTLVGGKYLANLRAMAIPLLILILYLGAPIYMSWGYGLEKGADHIAPLLVFPLICAQILYVCAGTRSTMKAVLAALGTIAAWQVLREPGILRDVLRVVGRGSDGSARALAVMGAHVPIMASFSVAAAALARKTRLFTIGVVLLIALLAHPFVLSMVSDGSDPLSHSVQGRLLAGALWVAYLGIVLYGTRGMSWRTRIAVLVAYILAGLLTGPGMPAWTRSLCFRAALLAMLVSAGAHAGAGVANRIVLATLIAWTGMLYVRWFPSSWYSEERFFLASVVAHYRVSEGHFVVFPATVAILTLALLAATSGGLDRFLGRNG